MSARRSWHAACSTVAERFIEQHEDAATGFVWASGGVLAVMIVAAALGSRSAALPVAAVATVGTLVVLALGYRTGDAGGSLVYERGAGQAYSRPAGPADVEISAAPPDRVDDD